MDCEDLKNTEKLEEFSQDLISGTIGIDFAEAIKTNEAILKKMEPFMASLDNVIKADPAEKEEYYVESIENAKANVINWKKMFEDMETISLAASWEQDPLFPKEMEKR